LRLPRDRREQSLEQRTRRFGHEIGRKLLGVLGGIGERKRFGKRLDEEIERVDDGKVGEEIDRDAELVRLLAEYVTASQLPFGPAASSRSASPA
jgi:hypothetical protein